MKKCENCGKNFEDSFSFCPYCGKQITSKDTENGPTRQSQFVCFNCHKPIGKHFSGNHCPNCGVYLYKECLNCGELNWWADEYCKKCGVKYTEAKLSISNDKCKEWLDYFYYSFPHYNDLYYQGKLRKTKQMKTSIEKLYGIINPDDSKFAFVVQITNRLAYISRYSLFNAGILDTKEFCLDSVQIDNLIVDNGFFFVFRNRITILDCDDNKFFSFEHHSIRSFTRSSSDTFEFLFSDNKAMQIHFHLGSKLKSIAQQVGWIALGIAGSAATSSDNQNQKLANLENRVDELNNKLSSINLRKVTTYNSLYEETQAYMDAVEGLFLALYKPLLAKIH